MTIKIITSQKLFINSQILMNINNNNNIINN